MRDPAGRLRFEGGDVFRDLVAPLQPEDFLHHPLARQWVGDGRLVSFDVRSERQVVSPRLPFVTQPSEWTDAQCFEAARLTLSLQSEAVEAGFDMKDASAWNVLYDGCHPVFCDLLSFEQLTARAWWALGQYARHFLLPLLVSRHRGLRAREAFTVWRDGLPADTARQMLGRRFLFSRYGAFLARSAAGAHSSVQTLQADTTLDLVAAQTFRRRLHATLSWQLDGVRPAAVAGVPGWAAYEEDRPHYVGDSLSRKRDQVGTWLARLKPAWTLDLGCNAGEFSTLALEQGSQVIALDADHDSVQRLFLRYRDQRGLHPVVAPLDDLRAGRGWAGAEHPGLTQRLTGCADVVLMLALIHHLAIGTAVPLEEVARFAWQCTRDTLIVEILGSDDPQLVALCQQRKRQPEEFSAARQREVFLGAGFELMDEQPLAPASRSLLLLRKRSSA